MPASGFEDTDYELVNDLVASSGSSGHSRSGSDFYNFLQLPARLMLRRAKYVGDRIASLSAPPDAGSTHSPQRAVGLTAPANLRSKVPGEVQGVRFEALGPRRWYP